MLEIFDVKVGLHQVSLLSPVLCVIGIDAVPREAKNSRLAELLYGDDFVLIAPTMEQLGRRHTECRVSILYKILKVNAGNSRAMVGSSGGKMIENS